MKFGSSFFIAARTLMGRPDKADISNRRSAAIPRKEKALSSSSGGMAGAILGIGISLVPLVLVLIVSDGMIQGITRRYMETKTYHLQVAVPDGMDDKESQVGIKAIQSLPGVTSAFLEKNGSGVAVSASSSGAVMLRAIDPAFFSDPGTKGFLTVDAGKIAPAGNRDIVIGSSLAATLKVKLGDSLTLITPNPETAANETAAADFSGYSPRLSFFKVSGIVSAGYRDLDALWAFITPEMGMRLLTYPSSATFFGVKVAHPYANSLGAAKNAIIERLGSVYPDWFDPYLARTWPEIEKSLYKSFGTTKSMLLFIMGIALIIAALNLGSALSTFVAEHSIEIAVLRSVGASDAALKTIFVGAGLISGSIGTVLGLTLGLLISWNVNYLISGLEWLVSAIDSIIAFASGHPSIPLKLLDPAYYLEKIPVSIDFSQIALIATLSVALSAVASLIPALKASRISVQELIRKM